MKTRYSLLLAVAALLLFPAARAATITVCPAGPPTCDYSSIQAAINAASDGDVIAVGAGTYNESLRIDKELTIDGDSPGSVIINVSGENSAGIRTRANNVTLQDFTVTGAASSYSVKIEGINGVPATGIVIDNVVVQNSSKTGIDVNGVNGLTIEDVTVRNSQLGNGVTLTDVRNATLERITTENNTWGGVAMYTSGEFFPIGVSDITLIDINAQEVEEPSALPIYVDLLKPGSSAAAPALRIFLDPEEWPYHLHSDREALTVFDNHRRMNSRIWRGPR
ncbi:MAG TPA: right-handed parallel beta-helix repeat-containing protein, partial [bacterium]|nr:right-handed parallel beta-helix repeat-containing protein [bacterium]